MGFSSQTARILLRLHNNIQSHGGQNGLEGFRSQLHELCGDGRNRVATEEQFREAMIRACLLTTDDASALFRGLFASAGAEGEHISFAEVRRVQRSRVNFDVTTYLAIRCCVDGATVLPLNLEE